MWREMDRTFCADGCLFLFFRLFLEPRKGGAPRSIQSDAGGTLLVETDAPSMLLPPEKERFSLGTTELLNHPGNLTVAYQELARLRGISADELQPQVEQNFIRLFGSVMG